MDKNTKRILFIIGVLTLGVSLYSFFEKEVDYMTYFGGWIGITLIVLAFISKTEQKNKK